MNTKEKIIGGVIAATMFAGGAAVILPDVCLKDVKYEMTVVDNGQSAAVRICESEAGLTAKKSDLVAKIGQNKMKSTEGVSPSVEALLIAANEPEFAAQLTSELLKKYDDEKHAFKGDMLDADLIEQRALFFELASLKCDGPCQLEGKTPNEWAFNLLIK